MTPKGTSIFWKGSSGQQGSQLGKNPQAPLSEEALAFLSQTNDDVPRSLPPVTHKKINVQKGG